MLLCRPEGDGYSTDVDLCPSAVLLLVLHISGPESRLQGHLRLLFLSVRAKKMAGFGLSALRARGHP